MFRLAYRQTEGLIGSLMGLLGLDLPVPDHTTLSRRAATLEMPRPRSDSSPDAHTRSRAHASAGGQHGPEAVWARRVVDRETWRKTRRSWKMLHLGVDADTGQIVAAALTGREADDGAQVGPLLAARQ